MNKRFRGYRERIREEVKKVFDETHTPHEVAFSFALGIFITTMPTLGLGFVLFYLLAKTADRISSLALFSTVLVVNPLAKPVFLLASLNIGSLVLTGNLIATSDPLTLVKMLYIGSLIIASISAFISYFIILAAVKKYRTTDLEILEDIEEELIY